MKKIILLAPQVMNRKLSIWLLPLLGLFSILNGIWGIIAFEITTRSIILNIFLILTGLSVLMLAIIQFNPANSLAPKVVIDEESIEIREEMFKNSRLIDWHDIQTITFEPFVLTFLLKDNTLEQAVLNTDASISIQIKQAIREIAEKKSIPVIG